MGDSIGEFSSAEISKAVSKVKRDLGGHQVRDIIEACTEAAIEQGLKKELYLSVVERIYDRVLARLNRNSSVN